MQVLLKLWNDLLSCSSEVSGGGKDARPFIRAASFKCSEARDGRDRDAGPPSGFLALGFGSLPPRASPLPDCWGCWEGAASRC